MAWGRKKVEAPPPSAIKQVLPLLITLIFLGVAGWVGYQIWVSMVKIKSQARKQMGENFVFTKDGVQVKVQNVGTESYVDATQSWVVKAWNLAASPNPNDSEEHTKRKRTVLSKPRMADSSDDD